MNAPMQAYLTFFHIYMDSRFNTGHSKEMTFDTDVGLTKCERLYYLLYSK
jgi:hypothetical protein